MTQSKTIILLDNFDSFTHNLLHLLQKVRPHYHIQLYRNNDAKLMHQLPDALIIGPGPMTPSETGLLKSYFDETITKKHIPVLGVCLGMQFLGWYFNIQVTRSTMPAHGMAADIKHASNDIFEGIPMPMKGARYNSLEIQSSNLECQNILKTLAVTSENNAVMALRHHSQPWVGVQFHPESFLTEHGNILIDNFFKLYVEI